MLRQVLTFIVKKLIAHIFLVFVLMKVSSSETHAYYNVNFGFKQNAPSLNFATSSQTILASLCSGIMTVTTRNGAGVATNVASNLTVNLTGSSGVTFYSDSNCESAISDVTVLAGTSSKSFYFLSSSSGSKTITAAAASYLSANQSETISTNGFIWTGNGGNANWATAGNWSGGVAPSTSNIAVFDGSCASNCSPTIAANISVSGIRISSGYTGTISQGSSTITLSSGGWVQLGGTFSGGSATITNTGKFILSGGTFTSTSGTFNANGTVWSVSGTGSFVHNSGTVSMSGSGSLTFGAETYNNFSLSAAGVTYTMNSTTLNVGGTLTLSSASNGTYLNSGTVNVYGNLTFAANYGWNGSAIFRVKGNASGQTISGSSSSAFVNNLIIEAGTNNVTMSGTFALGSIYTVTSVGTMTTTGSTVNIGGNIGSSTLTFGSETYNNITFSSCAGTYSLNSTTLNVGGTLTTSAACNNSYINSGTVNIYGNLTLTSNYGWYGSAVFKVKGNASGQTITGSSGGSFLNNLIIDAGSNNVTLSGTIAVGSNYTVTSVGTLTTTSSTLNIGGMNSVTMTFGTEVYNNVTIDSYCSGTYSLNSSTLNVGGTFTLKTGCNNNFLNSGIVKLYGNLSSPGPNYAFSGTAELKFVGSTDQTITCAPCTFPSGNITVDISNNESVILGNSVSFNSTGQTVSVLNGSILMNGYNLTVKGLSLASGTSITKGGGALTVNGSSIPSGAYSSGTVDP